MPPKQSRAQKDAAAAKQAERRRAFREAQTAEETRAELDLLAQQQRVLRSKQTPLDRRRASERLEIATTNRA